MPSGHFICAFPEKLRKYVTCSMLSLELNRSLHSGKQKRPDGRQTTYCLKGPESTLVLLYRSPGFGHVFWAHDVARGDLPELTAFLQLPESLIDKVDIFFCFRVIFVYKHVEPFG